MSPAFKWVIRKTVSRIWNRMGKHASAQTSWLLRKSNNSSWFGFWLRLRIESDWLDSTMTLNGDEGAREPEARLLSVLRAAALIALSIGAVAWGALRLHTS